MEKPQLLCVSGTVRTLKKWGLHLRNKMHPFQSRDQFWSLHEVLYPSGKWRPPYPEAEKQNHSASKWEMEINDLDFICSFLSTMWPPSMLPDPSRERAPGSTKALLFPSFSSNKMRISGLADTLGNNGCALSTGPLPPVPLSPLRVT